MADDFTHTFFEWAASQGISRDEIAETTGNSKQTVSNWKSVGIPKAKRLDCQLMMDEKKQASLDAVRKNLLVHELNREQFNRWNRAALAAGKTIEDWAFDGLEQMAEELLDQRESIRLESIGDAAIAEDKKRQAEEASESETA